MIIEISDYVIKKSRSFWSISEAISFSINLSLIVSGVRVDYDRGAKENWVRLILCGRCVAIVNTKQKIIFSEKIFQIVDDKEELFIVESLDSAVHIEKSVFENVFGREFPSEYGCGCFSINDLYALTSTS